MQLAKAARKNFWFGVSAPFDLASCYAAQPPATKRLMMNSVEIFGGGVGTCIAGVAVGGAREGYIDGASSRFFGAIIHKKKTRRIDCTLYYFD